MIEMYALMAVALIAVGAIVGLLVIFAVGIHREEKARSFRNASPGGIPSGLRAVLGIRLHPRLPDLAGR